VASEKGHDAGRNGDQSVASVALGLDQLQLSAAVFLHDSLKRTPDEYGRLIEVNVFPFQAERLSHAQAERQHRAIQRPEPMLLTRFDELLRILDREHLEIHTPPARRVGELDDVAWDEKPFLGLCERRAEDGSNVADRLAGESFGNLCSRTDAACGRSTDSTVRRLELHSGEPPLRGSHHRRLASG
jgi:hypothetical protein